MKKLLRKESKRKIDVHRLQPVGHQSCKMLRNQTYVPEHCVFQHLLKDYIEKNHPDAKGGFSKVFHSFFRFL